jgi:hypothetical protein
MGGGDVEKTKLIGAFAVVNASDLDRITGIAKFEKLHSFNYTPGSYIQAGNYALG